MSHTQLFISFVRRREKKEELTRIQQPTLGTSYKSARCANCSILYIYSRSFKSKSWIGLGWRGFGVLFLNRCVLFKHDSVAKVQFSETDDFKSKSHSKWRKALNVYHIVQSRDKLFLRTLNQFSFQFNSFSFRKIFCIFVCFFSFIFVVGKIKWNECQKWNKWRVLWNGC